MRDRREGLVVRLKLRDERGSVIGETDAVSYRGLLSLAHEDGLRSVRTRVLQLPTRDNGSSAVVFAVVRTCRGVFTGIGDASPSNVDVQVAPHIVRVAETRAIARAFRLAVNVGEVSTVELMDDAAAPERRGPPPPVVPRPATRRGRDAATPSEARDDSEPEHSRSDSKPERFRGRDDRPNEAAQGDERAMSAEQRRLLFRLAYEQGESRDGAAARVLAALGVERFEWATRAMASRAIDALRAESRNGKDWRSGNGAAPHD